MNSSKRVEGSYLNYTKLAGVTMKRHVIEVRPSHKAIIVISLSVFLICGLIMALVGCGSSSPGGAKNGAPAPSSSSAGFTANCTIINPGATNTGIYPEVTFNNPTSQDESIINNQVNVIFFNQTGGQIGTGYVNTPSVIAAGQDVTTEPNAISGDAPDGTFTCSVGPYQINP